LKDFTLEGLLSHIHKWLYSCLNSDCPNNIKNENNNKEVKESKHKEELARENTSDYIRKNGGRIPYIDDDY
jgi:hypothetical protein